MKIQQIRNAMVRIRYAGKTFLTDPWLAPRGSMGTFRDYPMFRCRPERLDLPLPLCDLPMPVADILAGVDAYIVTHVHPDHIDMAADGSVGAPLDKAVPVFVQSEEDAAVLRRSGFAVVKMIRTWPCLHDLFKGPVAAGRKVHRQSLLPLFGRKKAAS